MEIRNSNYRKFYISFFIAFIVLAISFFIYSLLTGIMTFSSLEHKWDGVSVASQFYSGNGTIDNPYIIHDETEFIYFKQLIEGDQYKVFQNLYYALDDDLDFDNKSLDGIGKVVLNNEEKEDRIFKGHLDGRGHTIHNILIDKSVMIDDVSYYSFFTKVEDVNVTNLNINSYRVITEESSEKVVIGIFGDINVSNKESEEDLSIIDNIAIHNISVDYSKVDKENYNIGIMGNNISEKVYLHNIYVDGNIIGNNKNHKIGIISGEILGRVEDVVSKIEVINNEKVDFKSEKINSQYIISDGKVYLNGEEIDINRVVSILNESIKLPYYWIVENDYLIIKTYEEKEDNEVLSNSDEVEENKSENIPNSSKEFSFALFGADAITLHDSGVDGNTVYVNDLDSDYNYYMGRNYTNYSNGSWPSGNSYEIYSNSNLAEVYISYRGDDINSSSLVGKVSLTEQYSNLIYYKYYPIEDGYVTIPLIDNPFANRPNNRAFNGWVTDYDGAIVSLDVDTYTRYVKVPASSHISITMHASWTEATVVNSATSSSLKSAVMQRVATGVNTVFNVPTLYSRLTISSGNSSNGVSYPNGAVNENGQSLNGQRCRRISNNNPRTCVYYTVYNGTLTEGMNNLYQLSNGVMTSYVVPAPNYVLASNFMSLGDNVSGYFKKVRINGSKVGYYDNNGVLQTSGTCNGGNSCDYYELMQYADNNLINQTNYADYYYLTTRDTNIVYLTANINGFSNTKPITVTGINNGNDNSDYRVNVGNSSISAGADLRIEYCHLYSGEIEPATSGPANSNYDYVYGNFYNVKIGRGMPVVAGTYTTGYWWNQVTHDGTYFNARGIVGGRNNSTSDNPTKYRLVVESGYYNYISGVSTTSSSATYNVVGEAVYGNDIDRVNNENDNLGVYYNVASSYGGTVSSGSYTTPFITTMVKSGTYGEDTTDTAAGAYVGGLNGGTLSSPAVMIVEGGKIMYLNGGPLVSSNMLNYNSIYIYIKGGEIDCVFGGAARTETYGNRIISMTGGTINYSIFGGSNGVEGNNSESSKGTLNGKTFIRVGGDSVVGNTSGSVFGVEAGSVFGAGNGNETYDTIGAVNDSRILIADSATIKQNVYGGGNHGAVASQNSNNSISDIVINGGHIKGSVYGGGNMNGSGSSSVTSTVSIQVNDGDIDTSVFGGSRFEGIIYGSTSVAINGGEIGTDVYGGGEGGVTNTYSGTFVRDNVIVEVNNGDIAGNVYGGSAFGTVNAINENTNITGATTQVTVNGGTVQNNVFGGGKGNSSSTPKVVGNIVVIINGGSIGKVFGGFDASGKPTASDVVFLNGGTIGNAFGGGNNANQDSTDIRLQGSTINGNLYGGSNLLGTVTTSHVTVTSGSVVDIYGGNNLDGRTNTSHVLITGGTISGDVYGGGNQAESTTTNVEVNGAINIDNVYGGGNQAGVSNRTNVNIAKGTINGVYGGSNQTGTVGTTNVNVGPDTSNYYDDYTSGGSGLEVSFNYRFSSAQYQTDLYPEYKTIVDITPVFRNTTGEDFDEWSVTMNIPDSRFFAHDGDANIIVNGETYTWNQDDRWWGTNPIPSGSTYSPSLPLRVLFKGTENDFRLIYDLEAIDGNNGVHRTTNDPNYLSPTQGGGIDIETIYGGNNIGGIVNISNVTLNNGTVGEIYGGGNQVGLTTSNVEITGGNVTSVYGGSNRNGNVTTSNVTIGGESTINITDVYGGNNLGGVTSSTNIEVNSGTITTIYGGGNEASVGSTNVIVADVSAVDIYGGGNAAGVTGNTFLDINGATVSSNIYGGGNEGVVQGSTNVYVTNAHISGNAFAGGNGSTAVVHGNSTITIDGSTEIGTASTVAPVAGCVFGSGNAASTGIEGVDTSRATVNIVGGIIHGNVYGGPKMAVVYGTTNTNIGTSAVSINGLVEDDIHISGTVFGGGESNASGSETYDWTFISVTRGINVDINGTGYINNNHDFIINGSVFGSGNASSSSGNSTITIKNLGSRTQPNKSISIQRANDLIIDHSVIELVGTTDRTNEYSDILYSFNMIDKLTLKNDSVLLLQHNANMLKELYSGVDSNGQVVPAEVEIDDDNQTVTKNTDNRIYMIPNQNLNITINQGATAYGRVTGMTFFGMYQAYDNGTYRYGLYDDDLDYGDTGNAGLEIVGGSYVLGLHHVNHDITKDGFYSNYLNDDYSEVTTAYIDPSAIGSTGYRWIIGFEAINYEFTLTASKYSSLGTYELQLIDFADGNTDFTVIGFDASGLNPEVQLVDSSVVPRVGRTQNDANNILGLSMKAETQEWTGYGTTKLLDDDTYTGTREYRTDSRQIPPSLMFYLYHAKNINREGRMGTVVLTLRADIPRNAIEYDISFITVTINLVARKYDDADSYDASITYDKRYDMPSSTLVNITNQSQFTAYYSLIAWANRFEDVYGNNNQNYHVLTTNNPLPVNTMITMLDYGANDVRPEYYYFKVTQAVYDDSLLQLAQYNEVVYPLRNFIKMDSTSTNNTYQDSTANRTYYDSVNGLVDEEFIFIFDFKDTTTTGEHLDNSMLFELRNHEDRTVYNVLGIRESLMVYNTYDSSNIVLNQTISNTETYLYYNIPDEFGYSTRIQYNETENRQSVIDTNYESSSMGLNVAFFDKDGVPVSSSMLIGTSIMIDNHEYFADGDGIFRIKLANKVSNLNKTPTLTVNKDLPAGEYKIRYTLFASDDGLHNSIYENSVTQEFTVYVVNSNNSIVVDGSNRDKIIDGETGLNMNDNNVNVYHIKYTSQLNNPNVRVELFKRNTDSITTNTYTSVPFRTLFSNAFVVARDNEMYVDMNGLTERNVDFNFQSSLTSGTYRIVFKLYDNNQLIDSETKYVIIHKKIE